MRVPPELDSLMWAIAEENSPSAAEEFGRRYPGYREELARRQAAVLSLRLSKPHGSNPVSGQSARPIPRFTPRKVRPLAPAPGQIAFASVLALGAIAAASFTVSNMFFSHPKRTPPPAIPPPHLGPLRAVSPPVIQANPAPAPVQNSEVPDVGKPPATPKSELPMSLAFREERLKNVLGMVEMQSGLKIILAPGMPDPKIDVQYRDLLPMEILREMGRQYGFTAFDQGDGSVVIYPAVDAHDGGSGTGGSTLRTPPRRIGG